MTEMRAIYEAKPETPFILNLADIAKIAYEATETLILGHRSIFFVSWDDLSQTAKDRDVGLVRWVAMNDETGPEDLHLKEPIPEYLGVDWKDLPEINRASYMLFWSISRSLGAFLVWPE